MDGPADGRIDGQAEIPNLYYPALHVHIVRPT